MPPQHANSEIPVDSIIANELEICGSHGMQAYRYQEMIEMIMNGKLHPEKLVSGPISLENVVNELPIMNSFQSTGIKVITEFS